MLYRATVGVLFLAGSAVAAGPCADEVAAMDRSSAVIASVFHGQQIQPGQTASEDAFVRQNREMFPEEAVLGSRMVLAHSTMVFALDLYKDVSKPKPTEDQIRIALEDAASYLRCLKSHVSPADNINREAVNELDSMMAEDALVTLGITLDMGDPL